jgi:hypothetical protein
VLPANELRIFGLMHVWCYEFPPPTLWCLLLWDMEDDDGLHGVGYACCNATISFGSSIFVMNLDVQSALAPFEVRMIPYNYAVHFKKEGIIVRLSLLYTECIFFSLLVWNSHCLSCCRTRLSKMLEFVFYHLMIFSLHDLLFTEFIT